MFPRVPWVPNRVGPSVGRRRKDNGWFQVLVDKENPPTHSFSEVLHGKNTLFLINSARAVRTFNLLRCLTLPKIRNNNGVEQTPIAQKAMDKSYRQRTSIPCRTPYPSRSCFRVAVFKISSNLQPSLCSFDFKITENQSIRSIPCVVENRILYGTTSAPCQIAVTSSILETCSSSLTPNAPYVEKLYLTPHAPSQ